MINVIVTNVGSAIMVLGIIVVVVGFSSDLYTYIKRKVTHG